MKLSNLKSQNGAVLAFSLLMLVLLTLTGVRMIQQNKQQLTMAGNDRLLTQEFANAESVLANAKNSINTDATHTDPTGTTISKPAHQCVPLKTSSPYRQNIGLAGSVIETDSVKVRILAASCMSSVGVITKCNSYNPTTAVRTCYPLGVGEDCTTKTAAQIAALFTNVTDVCYQQYDPQCLDDSNTGSNCSAFPAPCPKEIYTIQVISTESGTTREIISDHIVGCGS